MVNAPGWVQIRPKPQRTMQAGGAMKPEGPSRTGRRMNTKAHRKNARVRNRPHRRHWFKRLPLQAQLAILDAAEFHATGVPLETLVTTLPDDAPDPQWMENAESWIQEFADSNGLALPSQHVTTA